MLAQRAYTTFLFVLLCGINSYGQEGAPAQLSRFPEDLSSANLEYDGIFDDGWVSVSSYFLLRQPRGTFFKIKGLIPQLRDPNFSTQLDILIDRQLITTKTLGCGEFTLEISVPEPTTGESPRRVELKYSKSQLLPDPDDRPVAAQLFQLGFVPGTPAAAAPATVKSMPDIVSSAALGSGKITLGSGWHELERVTTTSFRWVNNDAEIIVEAPAGKNRFTLSFEIEPGPGVGLKPFELCLLKESAKTPFEKITVRGREAVQANLTLTPQTPEVIKLHIEGGGLPAPNDARILNFRVFNLKVSEFTALRGLPAAAYAKKRGGMFDDGWVGKKTEFKLPQLITPGVLVLQGALPALNDFTNEVVIKLDGKEVARQKLNPGEFEIITAPFSGGGVRKVEILFQNEVQLPNTDQRMVSALIRQVSIEKAAMKSGKKP
ncbi:MAG: hypothetical protein HOP19_09570 [Acidobacteria bacterium]|nr:hypothetical protein [Acidobacteriota bacterium]